MPYTLVTDQVMMKNLVVLCHAPISEIFPLEAASFNEASLPTRNPVFDTPTLVPIGLPVTSIRWLTVQEASEPANTSPIKINFFIDLYI